MSMTSAGAPQPIQFNGKFLEILQKQKDGSWLITRDIRVSD
jgi:ketosteroid isomerase-like protein